MTADLIFTATTASHYEAFAGLMREYVEWCRTRYQDHPGFVDRVFGYQSLESELTALADAYGPPNGRTLLASHDGQICGGGAYRTLSDDICEMKRLFLSTLCRGQGTGRKLCNALIAAAQAEGFQLMRLDTGRLMTEAIAMYKTIGFRECAPYYQYPEEVMPYLVFMELPLTSS